MGESKLEGFVECIVVTMPAYIPLRSTYPVDHLPIPVEPDEGRSGERGILRGAGGLEPTRSDEGPCSLWLQGFQFLLESFPRSRVPFIIAESPDAM